MKKTFKIIIITLVILIASYGIYIGVERYRFLNKNISFPLIKLGSNIIIDASGKDKIIEEYKGLGYTFRYECVYETRENSDVVNVKVYNGEMKLFNKFLIGTWTQDYTN